MNLNELKKLSEIFENFAQPIATLIVGYWGLKAISNNNKNKSKKRK